MIRIMDIVCNRGNILDVVAILEGLVLGMRDVPAGDPRTNVARIDLPTVETILRPLQESIDRQPQHGDDMAREEWHSAMYLLVTGNPPR
jgi:hypothetical protein